MAATLGVVGYDSRLYVEDPTNPGDYIQITEPKDVTGPEVTCEFADMTHMQSPLGFREKKPTYKSAGNVTFKCNSIAADDAQDAMKAAAIANPPTLTNFEIRYPDATGYAFAAYVSYSESSPMAGAFETNFTLGITGNITPITSFTT
jgi:hypothetical protein